MRGKYPHSQFELFPGVVAHSEQKPHARIFVKSITISIEHFVVLAVVIIISMVTAFSIGVERGKRAVVSQANQRSRPVQTTIDRQAERIAPEGISEQAPDSLAPPAVVVAAPVVQAARQDDALAIPLKTGVEKDSEKQYTVQVASFKKEQHARQEAEGLEASGYEIFVLPKGKYSIVCVGKFARKDQAREISNRLKKKYKDCLIRSL